MGRLGTIGVACGTVLAVALIALLGVATWSSRDDTSREINRERAQLTAVAVASPAVDMKDRLGIEKDLLQIDATSRGTLVQGLGTLAQAIGGVVVFIGLVVAWRNLQIAQKNVQLAESGQITERFTRAIDQLGATADAGGGVPGGPRPELRLGGIYALERIARDSVEDHWTVIEVLTTYLHEHAAWGSASAATPPGRRADIEAILTVISRRRWSYGSGEDRPLELSALDLRNLTLPDRAELRMANLKGSHLERSTLRAARLDGACLENACLDGAALTSANFVGARMEGASMIQATLDKACLSVALLQNADFSDALLRAADLNGARLKKAKLVNAQLDGANLSYADLVEADVTGAHFGKANLAKADITRLDLSAALGLKSSQVASSIRDATTKLPPGVQLRTAWWKFW